MILAEHIEAARAGWIPRDRRPVWEVANGRYGLDRTQPPDLKWHLSATPWVRQILEASVRDDVVEVVIMAGSQVAKTAPMLIRLAWGMAHRPVPRLWITGDDGLAGDAYDERIEPTLLRCPDLQDVLIRDRLHMTKGKIKTKLSSLDIAGAKASGALHQNPYAEIYADECGNQELWPPAQIERINKRIRSYLKRGAKAFLFSAPWNANDSFHVRWLAGTQTVRFFACLKCSFVNLLNWSHLHYKGPIALLCESCGAAHEDIPKVRRYIAEEDFWLQNNPTPKPDVESFQWNALLPPGIPWSSLVEEWQSANAQWKLGNREPRKVFIRETLGEPWEDRIEAADWASLLKRQEMYTFGEPWPFAKRLFITADVQADVIYWTARAWGLGGVSRNQGYGRVFTFDDLRAEQLRLGVKDGDVAVDSGFRTAEVYQQCQRHGWKPMKGVAQEYFSEPQPDGKTLRKLWATSRADPAMGTAQQGALTLPLFLFCVDPVKDMLALFMSGNGPKWELPADVTEEYLQHLAAEKAQLKDNGKREWKRLNRANHWLDCECMNLVAAIAVGLVASGAEVKK